jgi:hypothetical protein
MNKFRITIDYHFNNESFRYKISLSDANISALIKIKFLSQYDKSKARKKKKKKNYSFSFCHETLKVQYLEKSKLVNRVLLFFSSQ